MRVHVPRLARAGVALALLYASGIARAQATGGGPPPRDTTRPPGLLGQDLKLELRSRLEAKGEQIIDERCAAARAFSTSFRCRSSFQPTFDFQFNLLTSGTVADRVHVDVDYDTQREFDASNNISIFYEGKPGQVFQKIEIGNVSFQPPPSLFLTSGIPSGNYGVQAAGHLGSMKFQTILAQQKGNVIRGQDYLLGGSGSRGTVQTQDRELEDYQIEARRFFFLVDPARFASYPNIDLLDAPRLRALAASLPDSVRPTRVFLYRLLIGGQPRNPNGPQFRLIGDPTSERGQVYELLRERVDYYVDPSLLWVALAQPLNPTNERLVVAYTVRVNGRDTTIASTGGTPDLAFDPDRQQFANLLWDPRLTPSDPAFRREVRSVYRVGGSDVRRETVDVRIGTGPGGTQEKPPAGRADTYLGLFGIAQRTNSARFDVENRLWPRPTDPNVLLLSGEPGSTGAATSAAAFAPLIRDRFIIFPSLAPFGRAGLAQPLAVPANDSIYSTPNEYLYSAQHPQSVYRIRIRYESEGGGEVGTIALDAVQIRQGSERLTMDGRPLVRGIDYTIDYDLGRVTFLHPATMFDLPRRVTVRYEENPLFQSIPTTIIGGTAEFPFEQGSVHVTAISQTQRTTFTRPEIGNEPRSSLVAGVSGAFAFDAAPLGRALNRLLPSMDRSAPSRITLTGEFAASRPQSNARGQAYLESFEGEGGLSVPLDEPTWYFGSQPALGSVLGTRFGATSFDTTRATTLAFQNGGLDREGRSLVFTIEDIDPQATLFGAGFAPPEPMLWLTLYPLRIGGLRNESTKRYEWQIANTLPGRHWRSLRARLGQPGAGADLSRVEFIEAWTLIDTSSVRRAANPTLILDFGTVSENSVTIGPETLSLTPAGDSVFAGKALQGFDRLDAERDPFSRAFNAAVNDTGIAGDVVDRLTVVGGGAPGAMSKFATCARGDARPRPLGDSRADCTAHNGRLDEEDLDADNVLNLSSARREDERIRRYIVDLSQPGAINRLGKCGVSIGDINDARPSATASTLCWANIRIPFHTPADSLNGGPLLRRVQSLRLTMLSGTGAADDAFTLLPIARLRLIGALWLKRDDHPLTGIAGPRTSTGGFVVASAIGTQDRDTLRGVFYEPPPGLGDTPENLQDPLNPTRVQANESSLRLQAGGLAPFDRAEAFLRFPEGQRSFMTYRELRVWARGRGKGWGPTGDLQFFIRVGRDADNFYLYRTPINAGDTRAAWDPEIRIRFERFFSLRAQLQNAFLRRGADSLACTGIDSALIARSGLPAGRAINRYAACANGYIAYSVDPAVSAPNLASVQELAVGIVRVDSAGRTGAITPLDTLEVWVDDIRLGDVENSLGFAGQFGATVTAGDFASLSFNVTRRDPNFRQLSDAPSYLTTNDIEVSTTWRLDKFLPKSFGVIAPLTITRVSSGADPLFLTQSDLEGDAIAGLRTPRTAITTYSLRLQRATPIEGTWFAPLVNHLALTGTYVTAGNRSEFASGHGRNFALGVDYVVAPAPLTVGADSTIRLARFNWRPTQIRISSGVVRNTDRRSSFLDPAASVADTARVAVALERAWRNSSSLEFAPLPAVTARWAFSSAMDFRDYRDTTLSGLAAFEERSHLVGIDLGLERERRMDAAIIYAPKVTGWVTPRLDLTSSYSLLRDPNADAIVRADNPAIDPRLPRRVGNTQGIGAGVTLDLARAAADLTGTSSPVARALAAIQPIDVTWGRTLLSAFDGIPETPGLAYQLAVGDIGTFRRLGASVATTAGQATQITVSHTLLLPYRVTITNRYQDASSHNWARRPDETQSVIDGEQLVLPDVSVRWTTAGPLLDGLLASATATARALHTRTAIMIPSDLLAGPAERRTSRLRTYPFNTALAWGPPATSLTTSAGFTYTTHLDSLPGSVTQGWSTEMSADVGRPFVLPERFGLKTPLRTRVSFQRTRTASWVSNALAKGQKSQLTDNGRQAISLSGDTDLSPDLTFTLQGSRVVNFDRNLDRRFTQTVFTAGLQMQFFGGASR